MEQMDKAEQNLAELERIAKELCKRIQIGTIVINGKEKEGELIYLSLVRTAQSVTREYILDKLRKWEQERAT